MKLCRRNKKPRCCSRRCRRRAASATTADSWPPSCSGGCSPASSKSSSASFQTSKRPASSKSCSTCCSRSPTATSGEKWSTWSPRFPGTWWTTTGTTSGPSSSSSCSALRAHPRPNSKNRRSCFSGEKERKTQKERKQLVVYFSLLGWIIVLEFFAEMSTRLFQKRCGEGACLWKSPYFCTFCNSWWSIWLSH